MRHVLRRDKFACRCAASILNLALISPGARYSVVVKFSSRSLALARFLFLVFFRISLEKKNERDTVANSVLLFARRLFVKDNWTSRFF